MLAFRKGDLQHAIFVLEHALVQCRAADIPLYLYGIMANLGLAYAWSGQVTEALPLLDEVVVHEKAGRAGRAGSYMILRLGEAYLLAGRLADALQLAERALVLSRDRKERGDQAWALWLLGGIALHGNPPAVALAETHYRQALTLAEEIGMRPLVAHCHAGLGTLYTTTGRWEQAHTELATAIALYRAMAMTFWLQQTEGTLAQVLHAGSLGVSH